MPGGISQTVMASEVEPGWWPTFAEPQVELMWGCCLSPTPCPGIPSFRSPRYRLATTRATASMAIAWAVGSCKRRVRCRASTASTCAAASATSCTTA